MTAVRLTKHIGLAIIIVFWLLFVFSWAKIYPPDQLHYGATFSYAHSRSLGLDWQANYLALLDDLNIKRLRLPVYWNEVQPEKNKYQWSELDWLVDQAEQRNVSVILAVGNRVPRWPECHSPAWVNDLDAQQRDEATLNYLRETIVRYRERPAIRYWQIENEPFLPHFGTCPPLDKKLLDKEIALARSLDPRPIIITDSGELSFWVPAASRADIFGSSIYRNTYSEALQRYVHYPIAPVFFRIKKNIANLFAHPQDWIIIELQGEPWTPGPYQNFSADERNKTMDLEKFKETAEFARQTGFETFYWWGAEWWYWEKTVQHNNAIWEEAKRLFATGS